MDFEDGMLIKRANGQLRKWSLAAHIDRLPQCKCGGEARLVCDYSVARLVFGAKPVNPYCSEPLCAECVTRHGKKTFCATHAA